MSKHPIAGSDKPQPEGARCLGACKPDEKIEVVVMLRRQNEDAFRQLMQKINSGAADAVPVSREEFSKRFGASASDVARTEAFAKAHGLTVVRADPGARSVVLSGTIAQFSTVFGVKLKRFEHHAIGEYRGRTGPVNVPEDMKDLVTAVLGLDSRPQVRPHFRFRPPFKTARSESSTSYTPLDLARLYDFPGGDGSGQCVGIIELGGGYSESDLSAYFSQLGVAPPNVVAVGVDQANNAPSGNPNGPDGEVTLDIEIVGAIVPGARIAVYFTANSDAGFIDAVNHAIHDDSNKPSVISISWGGPETNWTSQSQNTFDEVLQSAAALGVTVCAASGDSGSSDGASDGDHVDFPASSPYVLACGGTHLLASASEIRGEVVWNDGDQGGAGGGGVSAVFALPVWQSGLNVTRVSGAKSALTKRGVPDVAGDASPLTGYDVIIGGTQTVVGGTSAVAPLWAGRSPGSTRRRESRWVSSTRSCTLRRPRATTSRRETTAASRRRWAGTPARVWAARTARKSRLR
ncbi:Kumamolysin [Candidatus Burkholderia crenata]|nr:Kumamolysin [Candidatus Burkholderia crenata]